MLFNNTNISCDQRAAGSSAPVTMPTRMCPAQILQPSSSGSVITTMAHSHNIPNRSHYQYYQHHDHNHHHHNHNQHHHNQQQQQQHHLSSPQSSDQNCDKYHAPAKGIKRRNDSIEGAPVVLGSVSTNVALQHAHERNENIASASVFNSNHLRCSPDKCSSYFHSSCHESVQQTGIVQSLVKQDHEHNNDDGNSHNNQDACETDCDGEDYDYETILAKILNEKKLALSNSPEVIEFLLAASIKTRNLPNQDKVKLE